MSFVLQSAPVFRIDDVVLETWAIEIVTAALYNFRHFQPAILSKAGGGLVGAPTIGAACVTGSSPDHRSARARTKLGMAEVPTFCNCLRCR